MLPFQLIGKIRTQVKTITILVGLSLGLAACAPPSQLPHSPGFAEKEGGRALVPKDFLVTGAQQQEKIDPQLAQEIKVFLDENGMLAGFQGGQGTELPIMLNPHVQVFLHSFTTSRRAVIQAQLSRSERYLPMIRQIFQEQGLPQDLVYLPMIESGFNPLARSPKEAVGLWQFIEGTARRYGLKVDEWVDERRDPEKSTKAAARYLKDLHGQFGCWYLAAAGYNAGEKRVEGVVNRYDTRDFWVMAQNRLLPQETCNYVPQLIAAVLIAKNPEKYGFNHNTSRRPLAYVRKKVPEGTNLRQLAGSLGLPYEAIQELNPEVKGDCVPLDQKEYSVKVPSPKLHHIPGLAKGESKRTTSQDAD
ncbi:MAG: lytic transglycosylase domain-containing protein [Desulfobaccales bacterium]